MWGPYPPLTPSPGLIITLSLQEKSAFAYSCGWYYLNRDISLAQQDISVNCAVGTVWPLKGFSNKDICANSLLEGDWPHLEPARSLAVQHGRPAGLLAVSCSGAMSAGSLNVAQIFTYLVRQTPVGRATCGLHRGSLLFASRGARHQVQDPFPYHRLRWL